MRITVILCTYNRCEKLPKALDSTLRITFPNSADWEVLIVDNNSTDQTRLIAEEYCRNYPRRFRYLFEPAQGKSHALNAGVRAARGNILAFMDDDVTVEPTWLQNLTAPLFDDKWAGAGGRICLDEDFSPPPWMRVHGPYSMGGPIAALFDLGDKPGELSQPPFGTNMAFRKSMFDKYGDFRVDLGPRPGSEIRGEDTEFAERLLTAGERLWYAPSAVVYHPAQQDRLTKKFLLHYWFGVGQAAIRQRGVRPGPLGVPRYLLSVGMIMWTALRWFVTLDPPERFFWRCWTWMYAGKTLENFRQVHPRNIERTPTFIDG
jgi:glycosyltransferase involved in cell wall biosynthesis